MEIAFDYHSLRPSEQKWLREQTGAVKLAARRVASDIILLGRSLIAVRERIGHGRFMAWCRAELPWSQMQTCRLMRVAKIFGNTSHAVKFEPTALYLLSQPSTPEGAREYALELSGSGQKVTANIAKEILSGWRTVPDLSKRDARTAAPDRPEDRKPIAATPDPPPGWSAACDLVAGADQVHLTTIDDGDQVLYSGTIYRDGKTTTAVGEDLASVLLELAGRVPMKECRRCFRKLPTSRFSHDTNLPDGKNRYCKGCERERVASSARKRAASPTIPE